jgi:hypothetical protein
MPTTSLFDYKTPDVATSMTPKELVAEFEAPYANSSNRRQGIVARHFLCWLKLCKIALADVNNAVLERFAKHRCRCPRYSVRPDRDPQYMPNVRMFVHMLQQRGIIPSGRQNDIAQQFLPYITAQKSQGYAADVIAQVSFDARRAALTFPSLLSKRITPHILRHSCAAHTLAATGDIRKVSLWLGHASLQSTEIYLRADPAEKLAILAAHAAPGVKAGRFKRPSDKLLAMLAAAGNNSS